MASKGKENNMENNYQNNLQTSKCYEEAISVKEWIITFLIMYIPIINIIMLFIWAFDGKEKKSKSNYCKAALIIGGIIVTLSIVVFVVLIATMSDRLNLASNSKQNNFVNYLEDENTTSDANTESTSQEIDTVEVNDDEDYNDNYYDESYEDQSDDYENYVEEDDEDYNYIFPTSDTKKLTARIVQSLSKSDIRLAINEIYARHGRRFDDTSLQEYFNAKEWYSGTVNAKDFDEGVFNKIEKYNIRLLSKYR